MASILAMVHSTAAPNDGDVLPRPKRRRRRSSSDRGLPADSDLADLARAYLKQQQTLWPELVRQGFLAEDSEEEIAGMVADLKHRHRDGSVDIEQLANIAKCVGKLGGAYNRFSCDNSNATSIVDQLHNSLLKAREMDCFIPWQLVYCDYAVSGLIASRQGYHSYKQQLQDDRLPLAVTFIDDFTRASREELEWWKLAALSKLYGKELIGASDGFKLSDPNSDVLITVYGLLSRLFIKQLRQKVKRGMSGGHRRRHVLGRPPLGFTRRKKRDENGAFQCDAEGDAIHELCVDPKSAKLVRFIYRLHVVKKWSTHRIAKYLNRVGADGSNRWTDCTVRKILANPANVGVFFWNRYSSHYDPETQKTVRVMNPRSEWVKYIDRDLRLVPVRYYKAALRRIAEARRGHRDRKSRNQRSATTLFSGTLECGYCGEEIKLIRSASRYKQMGCVNGPEHRSGCELSSSKSTRVIESCILTYLFDSLLSERTLHDLLARANQYLEQERNRPRRNLKPLKNQVKRAKHKVDKLVRLIEDEPDATVCQGYHRRIRELQKEHDQLSAQLFEARAANAAAPPELDLSRIEGYLTDARGLLNQEVPAAAEALRALTGRIRIRQEPIPGRRNGGRWIAIFSPDLVSFLRHMSKDRNYPNAATLEYLCARNWIIPTEVQVTIEYVPKYVLLAPKFVELHQNGVTIRTLAAAHGMSWQYANEILQYGLTGERPRWSAHPNPGTRAGRPPLHRVVREDVVRLRQEEQMSFPAIRAWLLSNRGIAASLPTVRRAYDADHQQEILAAAERGNNPDRGRWRRIPAAKIADVRRLLSAGGFSQAEIARRVGVSPQTVRRERRKMRGSR